MIIELKDGTRYNLANYSCKRLHHRISSVEVVHNTSNVLGRGLVFGKSYYGTRQIDVELYYKAEDIYDFYLLRDELNHLFSMKESFYIIFKREPGKRYLVQMASQLTLEPSSSSRSFTVSFILEKKFAESVGTSFDLQNRKEWDEDLWQYGMGIDWDEEYQYEFTSNSFSLYNIGNERIDPRYDQLEVTVKAVTSEYLQIRNTTSGDVYRFNGALTSNDTLILSGVKSLKNGLSVFSNTNKKLISLAPGVNNFVVEGGTVQSIAFNFRFLYR